jgi:hypothetical protein
MLPEAVVESVPAPEPPPAARPVQVAAAEPPPVWQMVIIRGKTVNRIALPVPKEELETPDLRAEPFAGEPTESNLLEVQEGLVQDDGSDWEDQSSDKADVSGRGADRGGAGAGSN